MRRINRSINTFSSRLRRSLTDNLIPIGIFSAIALLLQYIWVGALSGACVVDIESDISSRYIPLIQKKVTAESVMKTYFNNELRADSMRVFLLSSDFSSRVEFAAVVNPNSSQKIGTVNFAPLVGDTYLNQKDAHESGRCINIIVSKEKPGGYRTAAERAKVAEFISCPIFSQRNFLIGYTATAYETVLPDFEIDPLMARLKLETESLAEILAG